LIACSRVSEISLPVADLSLSSASEVYVHHHSSSVALFTSHHHAADDSTASADVHSHTSSLQHRSTAQVSISSLVACFHICCVWW